MFLTYFTRKSAFKRFGFCPRGTGGLWTPLAAAITDRGGEAWLRSEVRSLTMADGLVTGAVIDRHGHRSPTCGTSATGSRSTPTAASPACAETAQIVARQVAECCPRDG